MSKHSAFSARIARFSFICFMMFANSDSVWAEDVSVWIGMSSPQQGEKSGIYHATLNDATGQLESPQLAADIGEPEFLALRPDGKCLYAACRLPDGTGGYVFSGAVALVVFVAGLKTGHSFRDGSHKQEQIS